MNHITLGIINIDKSFAFYRDVLQLMENHCIFLIRMDIN